MTPPAPDGDLPALAGIAGDWLFGRAIPLWLEHGVDWCGGGFHEAIDPQTLEGVGQYKRLRVTCRQIYVFAEGAHHGIPRARDAVAHGLRFLLGAMRHPDGGFVSRCALDGTILDPTRDLYDLAFALFALAHGYRLTRDEALRREALALLAFIEEAMRHPRGGYVEALPPALPRRQNPHMHLLEAALACAEHISGGGFDRLCDELAGLFRDRLFDAGRGVLGEYFEDDLTALRRDGRLVTEPGHHFEWAWLLGELARVRGIALPGARALTDFALRHGRDPGSGLLRGEVGDDGTVAEPSVRLWPHGEWLKAALTLDGMADADAAWHALAQFLATPVPGLWFERWDARAGAFRDEPAPATSLYHLTTAIVALRDRVARDAAVRAVPA